ncbi:MAG: DUF1501 domain-containing protein [Gemmataceae bacterium]
MSACGFLTPVGTLLARSAEGKREPARSVIVLWLAGGPSQLETFDPHPGTRIAAGTGAIDTALKGVQLAPGLDRTAAELGSISLVRSMVSKEGDHERGTYTLKTGYRPDPTVVHPSIGAVLCHELPAAGVDIPRHVSILPGQWPARGGFLGDQYDAFRTDDPLNPVPDTRSFQPATRDSARLGHLDVVEGAFARGRADRASATRHRETVADARRLMTSEQLAAFDVSREPLAVRRLYGETPFGRGCLAARRLVEAGVRCVEVTLGGFDAHVNNHEIHANRMTELDPALSGLVRDLRERKLLDRTVVVCGGEFGRTPQMNPAGGRDHWPTGFSVAVAGGGLRGGQVIGATDPEGKSAAPADPVSVGDLHATILHAVGLDPAKVVQTPIGRTVKLADGSPVKKLVG